MILSNEIRRSVNAGGPWRISARQMTHFPPEVLAHSAKHDSHASQRHVHVTGATPTRHSSWQMQHAPMCKTECPIWRRNAILQNAGSPVGRGSTPGYIEKQGTQRAGRWAGSRGNGRDFLFNSVRREGKAMPTMYGNPSQCDQARGHSNPRREHIVGAERAFRDGSEDSLPEKEHR